MNPVSAVADHWVVVVGTVMTIGAVIAAFRKYRDDVTTSVRDSLAVWIAGPGKVAIKEIVSDEISAHLREHEKIEAEGLRDALAKVEQEEGFFKEAIARHDERLRHVERMVERATTGSWVLPTTGDGG